MLTILGINGLTACSNAFESIKVDEFAKLVDNKDVQLLDVRTAEEYAEGHMSGAMNIDVKQSTFIADATQQLDTRKEVAVYCRSGRRSAMAAGMLAKEGYRVVNLDGGILEWQKTKPTTTIETDIFITKSGKIVRFDALMHASVRMVYDGLEILIDPVGRLGDRTVDYSKMPKPDYIFVTHEHQDHFDPITIDSIKTDSTVLITNVTCAEAMGFGLRFRNGDMRDLRKMIIETVPAYNYTEGHTQFHPKGRDNGFIITVDGMRIYFAGDTEDIPEMDDIENIDVAFLPCNQPYTMTPDQLINAAKKIKPRVLFPYHYRQTDVSTLPDVLRINGIETRIRHYE